MNLIEYMDSREMSYREFGRLVGCEEQSISNYVCRKRLPNLIIGQNIVEMTKGKVTIPELIEWWAEGNRDKITYKHKAKREKRTAKAKK